MDDRYFIVGYHIETGQHTFVGNIGIETDDDSFVNRQDAVRILKNSFKDYAYINVSISSIIEVREKDYKSFWEDRYE